MTEKQFQQSDKMIFPSGDWRCFVCLQPKRQMEIWQEHENLIYLICVPCKNNLDRWALERETLDLIGLF